MIRDKIYKISSLYNNENGATSILIIFMMIVLVTLGTFSIASANVNLKFGKKAVNLNKDFYALDSEGEKYICSLDYALADAEEKAYYYIYNKGYASRQTAGIPDDLQMAMYSAWKAESDINIAIQEIFDKVYLYFANKNIDVMSEKYPDNIITIYGGDNDISKIETDINLISKEDASSSLYISLTIETLNKNVSEGRIEQVLSGEKRYTINKWEQKRTPFEYNSEFEVWDGIIY